MLRILATLFITVSCFLTRSAPFWFNYFSLYLNCVSNAVALLFNVNKFKGRKPSNVNKTLLVSNAKSIAEIYLLFPSKAFSLRQELSSSQLVELWYFFCGDW